MQSSAMLKYFQLAYIALASFLRFVDMRIPGLPSSGESTLVKNGWVTEDFGLGY